MSQTVAHYYTTDGGAAPVPDDVVWPQGSLAAMIAPAATKLWINDGNPAPRLLLSSVPGDLPLGTANYLPLSGGAMSGGIVFAWAANNADLTRGIAFNATNSGTGINATTVSSINYRVAAGATNRHNFYVGNTPTAYVDTNGMNCTNGQLYVGTNTGVPRVTFNSGNNNSTNLTFLNAGGTQWIIMHEPGTAATDVGGDFAIHRHGAGNVFVDKPLLFSRATGLGVVSGDPVAPLGIATKRYCDDLAIDCGTY